MARQTRLTVPGYPHHVIQRGNDRQPIFRDDGDRQRLWSLLLEHTQRLKVAVHAYVFMDNHFHLLLTPETDDGLPQLMQAVGRSYVRYFNNRHGRSGTLWEGRYRSSLIETERYLLTCMAYIDLNPVRAGMVLEPQQHLWSSHRHLIGQLGDKLVSPHALFWSLGNTPFAREAAYAQLVQAGIADRHQSDLTRSALTGWTLGSPAFVQSLEQSTQRRLRPGKAGRPYGNRRED
ncbi:MAG: transposase [Betaproteobacteria bacterium]